EYQLTDLDPALVSRFNLYEFAPTVEDWLLWASEQGIDSRVIAFIQQYTQYLDGDATEHDADLLTAQAGLVKTPDRRAWVKVSQFLKPLQQIDDMHIKIIAGMVGTSAALAFKSSLSQALPITPEQVLLRFGRHKKTIDALLLQELVMLNDQIVLWVNSDQYTSKQEETARRNLLAYMRYLQETNKRETVAHLVSMLQSPKFDKAMTFAAASLEIIELLTAYIEGIKVE
ncbi:MAG: hypothetical protein ETSY2_11585, partial [Candidatus Entotheonella gemina]